MQGRALINTADQFGGDVFDFRYLHLQLIRIDLLIRAAVRRWQLAGQDFADKFRGLFISEANIRELLNRPIGGSWGAGVALPEEEGASLEQLQQQVVAEIARHQLLAGQRGRAPRLDRLASLFALSDFERDAFLICLAPALDTRYERIYGYLQDDITSRLASLELVFNLLLPPGLERIRRLEHFAPGAPLLQYGLLQLNPDPQHAEKSLLRQSYLVPPEIIAWLCGRYQPETSLAPALQLSPPVKDIEPYAELIDLPGDFADLLPQKPFVVLYGQDEVQQRLAAGYLAGLTGRPLLQLDLDRLGARPLDERGVDLFLRDAMLNDAIPVVAGWDPLPGEQHDPQLLLRRLNQHDDLVLIFHASDWPITREEATKVKPIVWVNCQSPTGEKRLQVWKRYLKEQANLPDLALEILAGQFSLTASQVQNAVYAARDLAFQEHRSLTIDDLYNAARLYSSRHLNSLAIKIEHRYHWEDIVLPEDELRSLREIANTIRWRPVVLEDWGVGKRLMPYAGVSALFAGPPGTGKTLAAQVIAAELKMDLYKIDLSTVVSKYIGETEKNLERIFSQARNSNAILFFDEADAIFGKRSEVKDAHDRYANIEVGYLLQRMETYDGVVILATNLRANMDDAFTRRIQFIIDFPFPDEKERARIWEVLFPPDVPRAGDFDFADLGARFRLTGGSIRNVIVSASFLAASDQQPVSGHHLAHAIRREMQKMGRLVQDKDLSLPGKEGSNGKNTA